MADNKPVHEIRLGRIRAALWANERNGGVTQAIQHAVARSTTSSAPFGAVGPLEALATTGSARLWRASPVATVLGPFGATRSCP